MEASRACPRTPEIKRAPLALANVSDAGIFEGYASVFGIIDLGRDRVERGAFRETLQRKALRDIKMLWQHDAKTPLGSWLDIAEDERGLHVRGQLNLSVAKAREVLALMRDGAVDGLSIGFHARKSYKDPRTGVRNLMVVDLTEISVVTFPMLPQARVAHVKTMSDADAWRQASTRLEWRLAAVALEMKFVGALTKLDAASTEF
jgi:HK97 family phage prohead protease